MTVECRRPADPLNAVFRASCPSCGSRLLDWMLGFDSAYASLSEEQMDIVTDYVDVHWWNENLGAEIWRCLICADVGLMAPTQVLG